MTQTITCDGIKFYRCKSGYYNGRGVIGEKLLHRHVWMTHNGSIPEGCHIHHIDEDKENNDPSNLALVTPAEHCRIHSLERFEKPEARARQSQNAKDMWAVRVWHDATCQKCGAAYQTAYPTRSMFCSQQCALTNRSKAKRAVMSCERCGVEFKYLSNGNRRRFCSKQCAGKAMWENALQPS